MESFSEIINHPARDLINELNVEVAEIMEQSDKRQFLIYVLELKSDV